MTLIVTTQLFLFFKEPVIKVTRQQVSFALKFKHQLDAIIIN